MAKVEAAGTLLWRTTKRGLEVLLVHPSGNYNRHKPWSIPKGIPEPHESTSDLEAIARRETLEETGVIVSQQLAPLGFIDYQKSGKRVHAFAAPAPESAAPHCASWEVDRAEFVPLEEARRVIHLDQAAFLDRLIALLAENRG